MLDYLYILLNILTIVLIIAIGFRAISNSFKPKKAAKKRIILIIGLLVWQIYMFAIAKTGIMQNYDFPPRFVLLLVLPAFLFTGIFLGMNRNNQWINAIPPRWLVFYQSFRILVESLFVLTVAKGILHPNVTIEGYNFDMIFGLTAPIIGYLVFYRKIGSLRWIKYWNYLGLIVLASIIFVFITTIYFPHLYGSEVNLMPTDFGKYPYVLIPGFLMPSAVFIHILSLIQIKNINK